MDFSGSRWTRLRLSIHLSLPIMVEGRYVILHANTRSCRSLSDSLGPLSWHGGVCLRSEETQFMSYDAHVSGVSCVHALWPVSCCSENP